jgi:hypothetical protein
MQKLKVKTMSKKSKWPQDVQKALLEEHQKSYMEGVSVGEDMGQDSQKMHDTAAIILVLRNRLHYTNEQINEFITGMNEEIAPYTMEDVRQIVDAYFQDLQGKV